MAKKFRFRLTAVESVRRAKEQETLRALAQAQRKYQEAIQAKIALLEDNDRALNRRQALASTAQSVVSYQLETEFITGNHQRMIQSDQAIFRSRKFVERALREVILAKRAVKAIEILREKAFMEFKTELRKKEQKDLEEIYVSRGRANEAEEWGESA